MSSQKTAFALFLALALFMLPSVAAADCTSPNEPEATIQYFSADKTYKYCDGTNWIDMSSGSCTVALDDLTDVVITSPVDGDALVYDQASGNWFNNTCDNPTGFDFADAVDVNPNTLTNSNIIQITGITCPATVTISGDGNPQYRTCTDSSCSSVLTNWTNSSVSISANQYIQLQLFSAGTMSTTRTADLDVGTRSVDWDVTTLPPKKVFVTSTSYTGNLGGVAGADSKCQSRAAAGSVTGTFKAWIAINSSNDPQSTFTNPVQDYVLLDGTVIANGWADLVDGTIDNKINRDEFNNLVGSTNRAWSTVDDDGTWGGGGGNDCIDYASDWGGDWGAAGSVNETDTDWTNDNTPLCNNTHRLYCFEQ